MIIRRSLLLLLPLLSLGWTALASAGTWTATYGTGSDDDRFVRAWQLSDDTWRLAGVRGERPWLLDLDDEGRVLDSRDVTASAPLEVLDAAPAPDGGALLVGRTSVFGDDGDGWVGRLGADGSLSWDGALGGTGGEEELHAVAPAPDGGWLLAGRVAVDGEFGCPWDAWVVKLSAGGGMEWEAQLDGGCSDGLHAVASLGGTSVLAGGITNSHQDPTLRKYSEAWVVELTADGTPVSSQTLGVPLPGCITGAQSRVERLVAEPDGGALAACSVAACGPSPTRLVKLEATGEVSWSAVGSGLSGWSGEAFHDVARQADGTLAVVGDLFATGTVRALGPSHAPTWSSGTSEVISLRAVAPAGDGGWLAAGTSGVVLRLDAAGSAGETGCVGLEPVGGGGVSDPETRTDVPVTLVDRRSAMVSLAVGLAPTCPSDPACVALCPETECANGVDDDRDGLTDCSDPDCALSCPESACDDGRDDDEDGLVDCEDPDCAAARPCLPEDCANGLDDDGNGDVDCLDDECAGHPECLDEDCLNGLDDDGDGATDCEDLECAEVPECEDADSDGDGVSNLLDCAPADPGSRAFPAEVRGLRVDRAGTSSAFLTWASLADQAGPGVAYDVAAGRLSVLHFDRGPTRAECLATGLAAPEVADDRLTGREGDGFYYLARGRNACGTGEWRRPPAGSIDACP